MHNAHVQIRSGILRHAFLAKITLIAILFAGSAMPAHAWLMVNASCQAVRYYINDGHVSACDDISNVYVAPGKAGYEYAQIDSSSVDEGIALNGWTNLREGLSSPTTLAPNAAVMLDTDEGLPRAYASVAYRADYGHLGAGGAVAAGGILFPDGVNPHLTSVLGAATVTANLISGDRLTVRSSSLPDGTVVRLRLSQHAHGIRASDSIGGNSIQFFYFHAYSSFSSMEGGPFLGGLDYCISNYLRPECYAMNTIGGPERFEFQNDSSIYIDARVGQGLFLYDYLAFVTQIVASSDWYGNGGMAINAVFDGLSTVSNTITALDQSVWIDAESGHNYMPNVVSEPSALALVIFGLMAFKKTTVRNRKAEDQSKHTS